MKLDLQLFGGRGAKSSRANKGSKEPTEINGRPVVDTIPSGFRFWLIGNNAPKGYIGLIRGSGAGAETRYFRTKYADEIANFRSAGANAMNYDSIKTLDREITRLENRIAREEETANYRSASGIYARTRQLDEMKRAREIRRKLGL